MTGANRERPNQALQPKRRYPLRHFSLCPTLRFLSLALSGLTELCLVRPMARSPSDMPIAQRFAAHLSRDGTIYSVVPAADPPDFFLEPGTWLELSDIYLSNTEAKFLNSARERKFSFDCSPDEPALRLLNKLDEKLGKTSYQAVYVARGAGLLLLTCQDCFFDEVNLARVHKALASYRPTNDQGFFKAAYFEYMLPGADRVYEVIYPRKS